MPEILLVARKEFRGFFASPAAYLFIGAYLAATLFVFFWVETFFARNIADVRPLFQWLPVLMIFLVAALTMRSWSEERRAGTLESLLTSPVRPSSLVLGKFAATLALVGLALLLTLPLPITVSRLGALDWGPVVGGYVATLFLSAAYAAIGLWASARTDNPIVALILSTLVCGLFYVVGSGTVTNLFGREAGDVLALLGTGRRFESITRGVLDFRDLYYYASIVGVFLTLNLFQLERLRWAGNPGSARHRRVAWLAGLAAANFAAANLWLAHVTWARVDITRGRVFTLSQATRKELAQLREPLLIRGYFSARTHPLLAPLVPELEDILREYAVAAGGKARVEFVDPEGNHAAEEEAASRFGIRPVPFQTASRYQASVVSSYFDIAVAYGDQHAVLDYRDLVEVKARGERELDVALKSPEYDITSAIRKVVTAYRAGGNPFESLDGPVTFHGYVSPDARLPQPLQTVRADLGSLLDELSRQANGKLTVSFEDPDANGGKLGKELGRRYGFVPQVASLLDTQPFWFYMVLEGHRETVQVPLPGTLDKASLKRSLEAALQRLAPGVLRTIAVLKAAPQVPGAPDGYRYLESALSQGARVRDVQLDDGRVPEDADLLLVLAPRSLGDVQRFAVDQFLMRGGSVVLATSPFEVHLEGGLYATRATSGLEDWLAQDGLRVENTMVLDPHSAALPVPVQRYVGGLAVQEIRMVPYPHFLDLRGSQLDARNPITASLGQLTVPWASPIAVDEKKNEGRKVSRLLVSSPQSWTSDALDVVPDFAAHPGTGYAAPPQRGPQVLAVAVQGRFDSFYKGKKPPEPSSAPAAPGAKKPAAPVAGAPASVIERSPDSARIVLVASNAFASDAAVNLASQGLRTLYSKPVELVQNAVDWSLEDPALLALRGRTRFAATLVPLTEAQERAWEYLDYALALAGLAAVYAWRRAVARGDRTRRQLILEEVKT